MLTKKIKESTNISSEAFLYWKHNGSIEKKDIKNFLSIGRESSNLLILKDDFVSRKHVRIEKKEDKNLYLLRDMNSRNGVFLNGSKVHSAPLKNNDTIQIGSMQFTFSFERYNNNLKLISQSRNEAWNQTLSRIPHLALSNASVLLLGPSGSGKEVLAHMLHNYSKRSDHDMVSINCSSLTESLVESELFGHKKGSYTGSDSNRKGAFVAADNSTLFMDEIGDLSLPLQPKLLRAIEYQEVKPVGGDYPVKVNVRIISATHQDLKEKIKDREFREDLYFRLNIVTINIPALKDRMEDFESFFNHFCLIYGVTFSSKAKNILKQYDWPGNIRELKNTIERAKAWFPGDTIDQEKSLNLIDRLIERAPKEPLWCLEKKIISKALKKYSGNQSKVSVYLDIPTSSLSDKIKNYNIRLSDYKKPTSRMTKK